MLWDPTFNTWATFGVRANSQFAVLAPDLLTGSDLVYGFTDDIQNQIIQLAQAA